MYSYRKMSPQEKEDTLKQRLLSGSPLHEPPHLHTTEGWFLISAATYEHKPHFQSDSDREYLWTEIQKELQKIGIACAAWVILPNHYHLLTQCQPLSSISEPLRRAHARTARWLNQRDHTEGRKVWYRFTDRLIRDENHYYTALNYIHNNPVKHGYTSKPQEWSSSSLHWYMQNFDIEWLRDIWTQYPPRNYGEGWDDDRESFFEELVASVKEAGAILRGEPYYK